MRALFFIAGALAAYGMWGGYHVIALHDLNRDDFNYFCTAVAAGMSIAVTLVGWTLSGNGR